MTRLRCYRSKDPTAILLASYTPAQEKAQEKFASVSPTATRVKCRLGIFIPFRDRLEETKACFKSLQKQRLHSDTELYVVLIDNRSTRHETRLWLDSLTRLSIPHRTVRADIPFNFSRINNLAVDACRDLNFDQYLFLNNDTVLPTSETLDNLLQQSCRLPDRGAVGCTLIYENQNIQHLFVAPGVKLMGAHPLKGRTFVKDHVWYQNPRPVAAVTGAALLIEQAVFDEVDGFDEFLGGSGQDLDLCLRLQKMGKINWTIPGVTIVHRETISRRHGHNKKELLYLYEKWGRALTHNPFFSRKLSRWSEQPVLTVGEGDYPWHLVID